MFLPSNDAISDPDFRAMLGTYRAPSGATMQFSANSKGLITVTIGTKILDDEFTVVGVSRGLSGEEGFAIVTTRDNYAELVKIDMQNSNGTWSIVISDPIRPAPDTGDIVKCCV